MVNVLQNVVFPLGKDSDVLPLYADPETWSTIDGTPVRLSDTASIDNIISRRSVRVREGKKVSYGTYFNAFPASYWQRWSTVENVTLKIETSGEGTVVVYRSNAQGDQQQVDAVAVTKDGAVTRFDLPLDKFSDGGWYWFDLIAKSAELVLEKAAWQTETEPVTRGEISFGMTTFNKPTYCVETLNNIAGNEELLKELDRIFLVDQGTQKVADAKGFKEVAAKLGDKLKLIEQPNLGGSGGFSRSMYETLQREDTEFLMLLDDDIEFETESALRALKFARYAREPILVGGHMFDLLNKPVMHAWAEVVTPDAFMWGPSFKEQNRHDFRNSNLRQTRWMHARLDSDYNGWWMTLIPKKVIAEIGLSIPVFIKWDDAEYGLRARAAGYRTVSMPGVALWHVSWLDKDDTQDWGSYFHTRNRIIAGLLHSNHRGGGKLLQNSGRQDIKKLLNMQYYATQLAVDALRDVLKGPNVLHETMAESMPRARAIAKDFPETRVYKAGDPDSPVSVGGRVTPSLELDPKGPTGAKLALFTAKALQRHWRRGDSENSPVAPELEYSKRDALWWLIDKHRSVIVGTADGAGKMWYRHDRNKFRRLLKESRELTKKIEKNWDSLAKSYRSALKEITSPEAWVKTFEIKDQE